jgi:hypothetical protein
LSVQAAPTFVRNARLPRPASGLSNPYLTVYAAAVVVFGLGHLVLLGADFACVGLAVGAVLLSMLPALRYGWRDMPALICLLSGVRYSATAIFWKALEFDALDDGLYAPQLSFVVVFTGMSAVVLAAFLAHLIWPRKPLFVERYSPAGLKTLLAVGLVGTVGIILVGTTPRPGELNTGLVYVDLLGGIRALMLDGFAIVPIAWLALNKQTGKPLLSPAFILATVAIITLSLVLNVRTSGANYLLALGLFFSCFRFPWRPLIIVPSAAVALFFALYVAPAIVDVRNIRQAGSTLSGFDFVSTTVDQIGKRITGEANNLPNLPVQNYYLKYLATTNNFIERLVVIQELDYVVALAGDQGTVGLEKFWEGTVALLPSWWVDDKSNLNPDTVLWIYGAVDPGFESFFEITPFGNAFSYGGNTFVFVSMFLLFFAFFLFFRMAAPVFDRSLFAIFLIVNYFVFMTGGGVNMLLGILFRSLPFETLLFWLVSRAGTVNRRSGLRS